MTILLAVNNIMRWRSHPIIVMSSTSIKRSDKQTAIVRRAIDRIREEREVIAIVHHSSILKCQISQLQIVTELITVLMILYDTLEIAV